jgi:hypothetical protein
MKALKIILYIIIALVIIWFAGGFFLPGSVHMERSANINAPDSVIFANVADFNNFTKWNPFYKMDPKTKVIISGPQGQPGYTYHWVSEQTGEGLMVVASVQRASGITWDMKFIKPFETQAQAGFLIAPSGSSCKVTWTYDQESHTTLERWMSLCTNSLLGKAYEDGLNDLKMLSESRFR